MSFTVRPVPGRDDEAAGVFGLENGFFNPEPHWICLITRPSVPPNCATVYHKTGPRVRRFRRAQSIHRSRRLILFWIAGYSVSTR